MKLHALQRAVARAVMQPLTRSERMQRKAPGGERMSAHAARQITPHAPLPPFDRRKIYTRQYWFRVLGSLAEDYPGLRAVLGGRRFESMCKAHPSERPSRSFTLRNLGAPLETRLRENPLWLRDRRVLALDMVRLEWADIEAFDGQAKPALRSEDLLEVDAAKLQLGIQPYVQLLELHYPVDDLLLEVKHGDDTPDRASNAVQERRKHSKVRAVAKLEPAQIFLAVHRLDYSVYFRRIEPEEFVLLGALRRGKTIERAIELAFRNTSVPAADRATFIPHSFQTWATLGWFCLPEQTYAGTKSAKKEQGSKS